MSGLGSLTAWRRVPGVRDARGVVGERVRDGARRDIGGHIGCHLDSGRWNESVGGPRVESAGGPAAARRGGRKSWRVSLGDTLAAMAGRGYRATSDLSIALTMRATVGVGDAVVWVHSRCSG